MHRSEPPGAGAPPAAHSWRFVGGAVALSLASRALGIVREGAIVALLGVHDFTDAYFATSSVVLWLQNFSFGAFLLYFVPRYLALSGDARRSWSRRWIRRAALWGAMGGCAFFLAHGRLEAALLSGRNVLGAFPAALLASAILTTAVGSVLFGRVVSTPRGIAVGALANLLANVVGLGVLVMHVRAGWDPASALPASFAATQAALLAALAVGAREAASTAAFGEASGASSGPRAESQLAATTVENVGYNLSAVLQQGIAGHLPAGAVTLSAYPVRLILGPVVGLLQPVQQRLLIHFATDRPAGARRVAALAVAGGLLAGVGAGTVFAAALAASAPWWSPAWQRAFVEHRYVWVLLAYGVYAGVVFSNQSLAQFFFGRARGWSYALAMTAAYAGGTLLKLALAPRWGILSLPLAALAAEGAALAWLCASAGLAGARRASAEVAT